MRVDVEGNMLSIHAGLLRCERCNRLMFSIDEDKELTALAAKFHSGIRHECMEHQGICMNCSLNSFDLNVQCYACLLDAPTSQMQVRAAMAEERESRSHNVYLCEECSKSASVVITLATMPRVYMLHTKNSQGHWEITKI